MSILETLASLATAKTVAAAAATTLAVGGATGLSIANSAVEESPADVEVPAGADNRAEQADLGAGNADRDTESDVTVEEEQVDTTDVDTQDDLENDAENDGRAAEVHASLTEDGVLTPEDGEAFGRAVADNARNGEPGAFGRSVADEARNGAGEDRGGEAATGSEAADQREEAKERRPEGTPAADERRPEDTPAEGQGSESRVDGEETATNNRDADRPGSAGAAGRP
jgi:hypothetical protein